MESRLGLRHYLHRWPSLGPCCLGGSSGIGAEKPKFCQQTSTNAISVSALLMPPGASAMLPSAGTSRVAPAVIKLSENTIDLAS